MAIMKRTPPPDFKEHGVDKSYSEIFRLICQNARIRIREGRFVYFLDDTYVYDSTKGYRFENLTPDYRKITGYGLRELKYALKSETGAVPELQHGAETEEKSGLKYDPAKRDEKFCADYNCVLESMILLSDRIRAALEGQSGRNEAAAWFRRMADRPAEGFAEAVQRLLFVNQIFWQTDHRLTGLGAWDSILYPYYRRDQERGVLTREEALDMIKDACRALHEDYAYKSNVLMGDTGQIFVLGKSDTEGHYLCNELTYLILEALMELALPEPKCVLRVNRETPRELLGLALDSIASGTGSPILANDDVIIPALVEHGIEEKDACSYTTSACWEPLIGGKSTSLNNMAVLNYLKAFDDMVRRCDVGNIRTFTELVETYKTFLCRDVRAVMRILDQPRFQYDPLLSVFTEGCFESRKDVSHGGAKYHDAGFTSVGMGNLIDTLYAVRELVFEKQELTMYDVRRMLILDFESDEDRYRQLKARTSAYGMDDAETIRLTNDITECVSREIAGHRTYLGGRLKTGLSGSAYVDAAKGFGASFDGRRAGQPFTLHISNEDADGYTGLINFSAQLHYGQGRFNGNVADLMVSPYLIRQSREKFISFLEAGIRRGFFELQMNAVDAQTLINAKAKPDQYPNLIVRVWGFSAYFRDLPEEYKDTLIWRALKRTG